VFLRMLARTGNVALAAKVAGMSRESAYRLRRRDPDGLFAVAWKQTAHRTVTPLTRDQLVKGHRLAVVLDGIPQGRAPARRRAALSTCDPPLAG
jgi:hypothetical protein